MKEVAMETPCVVWKDERDCGCKHIGVVPGAECPTAVGLRAVLEAHQECEDCKAGRVHPA